MSQNSRVATADAIPSDLWCPEKSVVMDAAPVVLVEVEAISRRCSVRP